MLSKMSAKVDNGGKDMSSVEVGRSGRIIWKVGSRNEELEKKKKQKEGIMMKREEMEKWKEESIEQRKGMTN